MVVGLGNPGEGYEASRHNVGFLVVDALAGRVGVAFGRRRYRSLFARAAFDGKEVLLVKPLTFMNDSGSAVWKWQQASGLNPSHVVVIHDDLDLPLGQLRIKARGSHGGHGGVRSIQETLGGGDFLRVKVGIGRPRPGRDPVAHVLSPFEKAERSEIDQAVEQAADAVEVLLLEGVQAAMNRYNVRASRRRGRESQQREGGEAREFV